MSEREFIMGEVPSIEALLGKRITQVSKHPNTGNRCDKRCDSYHRQRAPGVFIEDNRKGERNRYGGEHLPDGAWLCHYCDPTSELRDAYTSRNGRDEGNPFALSSLRIIEWADGRTVLIGGPRNMIGSTFLAYEVR